MIILFLTSSFVGLMIAIAAMALVGLPLVPAFALYMALGIALPLWVLVQRTNARRVHVFTERNPL